MSDNLTAWYNQNNVLDDLANYEEALAIFEQAITLNPDDATAWYNKGKVLNNLERYEEALASFEQALKIIQIHELTNTKINGIIED